MESNKTVGGRKWGVVKKGLVGLGGLVALLAIVVETRPSHFHVERSVVIQAPAEKTFARVNDFHAWTTWSPYEKLDPQLARTYSGVPSGSGAVYVWRGEKAGEGWMTIVKSEPSQIAIKLEFIKPFACENVATFSFAPTPEGTKVTWAMDGENGFVSKAFSLVFDAEKFVGADFERGLAELKSLAEKDQSAGRRGSTISHASPPFGNDLPE